jgi:putative oxidoreductase
MGASMVRQNSNILWGLFILRFGLGFFLAMWSIDKFIAPEITVKIFSHFYFLDISDSLVIIIGALELVLSLFIIFGVYKTATYGLGLVIHMVSTVSTYEQLLSPFGKNHLFIAAIPILFAFIALFLLRNFDTKWTLVRKKSIFS